MTTRVYYDRDSIQIDGLTPFPPRSLVTATDGSKLAIETVAGFPVASMDYFMYADVNGNTFSTFALARAYLDGEFVKTVTGSGTGPPGADGATWTVGSGTPTGTAKPNDLYLDVATGDVYRNN